MKQADIVDYAFPAEGCHKCEANFKHIKLQNENGFTEQTSGECVFPNLSSATLQLHSVHVPCRQQSAHPSVPTGSFPFPFLLLLQSCWQKQELASPGAFVRSGSSRHW